MKRRVGTITLGISLVLFGVLGVYSIINQDFKIIDILKFWPAVLIGLGVEVLVFSMSKNNEAGLKYDSASILFTVLLIVGAFIATALQLVLDFLYKLPVM